MRLSNRSRRDGDTPDGQFYEPKPEGEKMESERGWVVTTLETKS